MKSLQIINYLNGLYQVAFGPFEKRAKKGYRGR